MTLPIDEDLLEIAAMWLFALGIALVLDSVINEPSPPSRFTDERVLRRLEDGETIRVPRWHGHELQISAELVTDVPAPAEEA